MQGNMGMMGDSLFFGAGPSLSTGIFDGSFAPSELGDQWTSLMRETGFFPVGDAQASTFRQEPAATFGGGADAFPGF